MLLGHNQQLVCLSLAAVMLSNKFWINRKTQYAINWDCQHCGCCVSIHCSTTSYIL